MREKIERWPRRFPNALSTGVWLWNKLRVIDIDVSDAAMVKCAARCHLRVCAGDHRPGADAVRRGADQVALFARAPDNEEPMRLFNPAGDLILWGRRVHPHGSPTYRRPGEAEDAPTHGIDIFGGAPTEEGNCSRAIRCLRPAFLQ